MISTTRTISRAAVSRRILSLVIILNECIVFVDALFGKKKRKKEREAAEAELLHAQVAAREAEEELARLNKLVVVVFGHDVNRMTFYIFTGLLALIVAITIYAVTRNSFGFTTKKKRGNRPHQEGTLDVIVVGCGLPKKSMGWYHLTQLLDMPKVNVRAVVEPFFLDDELCPTVPPTFMELVSSLAAMGVDCLSSVEDLDDFTKPTLCLIAGRTPDNPRLFCQCVMKGASLIYLEKPGAPTVRELQQMKDLADSRNIKVYLGYNKNVTPYVQKAIALSRQVPNSHVFFCHNNSYTRNDLPEVFTRNSEGILKNMAIHELALLVTFFGVTVDTIDTFKVNTSKLFSEKLTIWKAGTSTNQPEYVTDFSRVTFTVTTKNSSTHVTVMADRCGGNVSFATVKDSNGKDLKKFEFPDAEMAAKIEQKVKADPEMMPYFFVQSDDYLELKNRVVSSFLAGKDAEGVATIQVGIEALKLAEYGTEQLDKALTAAQG